MLAVAGSRFIAQPATLKGYACYRVKNVTYPGIIEKPEAETVGCIYSGINAASWTRLDAFEGSPYIRTRITVATEAEPNVPAQAYVIPTHNRAILTAELWDFTNFLTHDLDTFMKTYFASHKP